MHRLKVTSRFRKMMKKVNINHYHDHRLLSLNILIPRISTYSIYQLIPFPTQHRPHHTTTTNKPVFIPLSTQIVVVKYKMHAEFPPSLAEQKRAMLCCGKTKKKNEVVDGARNERKEFNGVSMYRRIRTSPKRQIGLCTREHSIR